MVRQPENPANGHSRFIGRYLASGRLPPLDLLSPHVCCCSAFRAPLPVRSVPVAGDERVTGSACDRPHDQGAE
eukprot:853145-Prymnesium_polylepis.1